MDSDALLAAAGELLAIPSTADRPDQLARAVDLVLAAVGPGFAVERFAANGKPSALCHNAGPRRDPGTGAWPRFRVILNAHLDVVPAEPDQFRPRRVGDRLYARGAQDMKVSALVLAAVFREVAGAVPYPLALQLVADEEVGGRDGTLHQLDRGVAGDFVVIGEHSRLDVVADSKGLLTARLLAAGRGGHGAYPWLGDNALLKLMSTVDALLTAYPVPAEPAWRTTVNLARIETPNTAVNQIADRAQAWLDVRFPAEDGDFAGRTPAEIAAHLGSFCAPGVTVEVDRVDPPHHADHDDPDVGALRAAAREQGYAGAFLRKHGAADGRYYSARGIPAVIFGIGGDGQHGPREYADLSTVAPYHRALTAFLTRLPTRP